MARVDKKKLAAIQAMLARRQAAPKAEVSAQGIHIHINLPQLAGLTKDPAMTNDEETPSPLGNLMPHPYTS